MDISRRSFQTALLFAVSLFGTLVISAQSIAISQQVQPQRQQQSAYLFNPSYQVIDRIEIEGAQRVEPTTIMSYMSMKAGDEYNPALMDRTLKDLYATGLFADVSMFLEGSTLVVKVAENPVINIVTFEGNKRIDDPSLLSEIQTKPRMVFNRSRVQSDVSRLYEIYRRSGRFSANIEPKIITLDQNRVNLVFEIDEGPITEVRNIQFVGNEHFDDDRLRGVITTKETRWYRFLGSDDRYDPDRLAFDQELLRRFYLSNGYADFKIRSASAELSQDRDKFFLTFTVEEGKRYKVGRISLFNEMRSLKAGQLKPQIMFKSNDWYNADEVEDSIRNITNALGDLQYAFASVRPELKRNPQTSTVDITFKIAESQRAFVERIDIHGNVRTLDKVIRREFLLVEGDPFNRSKLDRSEMRIRDLGYFEKVKISTRRGSNADMVIVDVEVAEKSTGELSVGAGYSSSDGPLADFRIRERNFLGKGQNLLFSATVAGSKSQFDTSFTEPYFLQRDLAASVNAFHMVRDYQDESSFDQKRTGGGLGLGYPLGEKLRQSLSYRLERNDISNVDDDASRFIKDQEGENITSAVSQRLVYDDRDSKLSPTRGLYSWFDTEYAGLGGDTDFISGKLGATYYYPIADQWIMHFLAETGAIHGLNGDDIRINDRYFLGGDTLRGFARSGVGPRDLSTDDSLGGNMFYRATAGMEFPLGFEEEMGIKGHIFTDLGSLFDLDALSDPDIVDENSLRLSAGVGFSWRSPFGPVRLDFGAPILKEDYDEKESFRFSFGTRF